jgi:hypothetical protein
VPDEAADAEDGALEEKGGDEDEVRGAEGARERGRERRARDGAERPADGDEPEEAAALLGPEEVGKEPQKTETAKRLKTLAQMKNACATGRRQVAGEKVRRAQKTTSVPRRNR